MNNPRFVKNTRRKCVFTHNETRSVSPGSELSENSDSDSEREETIIANKRKRNNKEIAILITLINPLLFKRDNYPALKFI